MGAVICSSNDRKKKPDIIEPNINDLEKNENAQIEERENSHSHTRSPSPIPKVKTHIKEEPKKKNVKQSRN